MGYRVACAQPAREARDGLDVSGRRASTIQLPPADEGALVPSTVVERARALGFRARQRACGEHYDERGERQCPARPSVFVRCNHLESHRRPRAAPSSIAVPEDHRVAQDRALASSHRRACCARTRYLQDAGPGLVSTGYRSRPRRTLTGATSRETTSNTPPYPGHGSPLCLRPIRPRGTRRAPSLRSSSLHNPAATR
jgi:hypothetical protein